ncbi:MAG: thiamine phosphate synthase, partial [Lawsonibacter sp.]|nr:thiamine phosphate synthase [Lawsonibacter sp.]
GRVRALLGPDKLIGVSAHTVEEAKAAQTAGADYLGLGAVFPTGTKDDVGLLSLEALKSICAAVDIPTVAIGGISAKNILQLAGSGICGVAVVSALYAQPDIQSAARTLRALAQEVVAI